MTRPWAWPSELRRAGVLGINRRNAEIMLPLNPRRLYPRVDDKALTKRICEANGIPTPETYALIRRFGEIRNFPEMLNGREEFVIKPARGAAGRGVMVFSGRKGEDFVTSSGEHHGRDEIRYHLSSILSGLYSLGGQLDAAIIERRLRRHPVFDPIAVGGTPDIRIVVCGNRPVMAMLRLPTARSRGRANLHQGAVGVGVDLETGRTRGGVYLGQTVSEAPDTGASLQDVELPQWERILDIADRLSRALELGYIGIDIVLDADAGPMVLEANARPGLAIQIANGAGLMTRIRGTQAPT